MQITFDLNEFQFLIPAGRLGNLKSSLKWSSIEYHDSEFENIKKDAIKEDFNLNLNFQENLQNMIKYQFNNLKVKEGKEDAIKQLVKTVIDRPLPAISFENVMVQALEGLDVNQDLVSKKFKLQQLRNINGVSA